MTVTMFASPLFLLACFPETCSSFANFVLSGAITWHITLVVITACLIFPTGFSVAIGLIASVSIGDDATLYHLMRRGIIVTLLTFLAVGGAVLLAVEIYNQVIHTKNNGLPAKTP
jgi:hypothetical protein